mgnify:CR=1 FL=1
MWFRESRLDFGRRATNRRRDYGPHALLAVNARFSVQRSERMHRFGAIVLLLVVLAGGTAALWWGTRAVGRTLFSGNDRFVLRYLDISSDGRLRPEHIREYAHLEEGMNLFAADLAKVRRDLESVPVVGSVELERRLPDTLVVRVRERVPAARLDAAVLAYPMAVDREGVVLGPSSVTPHLPSITGLRGRGLRPGEHVAEAGVQGALRVLELCESPAMGRFLKVGRIDVGHPDYLDLQLASGERVLLGERDVETRLLRLCEIIKAAADRGRAIAAVDMTVDRNFPVQYR